MQYTMIFIALVVISFIVFIHELGHFLAARIFKIPVNEFAIGMGPLLLSKKGKSGTVFSLRALPIGGFCSFSKDDKSGLIDDALDNVTPFKKLIIVIAGPLFNIIFAFIIIMSILNVVGVELPATIVKEVVQGSIAEKLGLEAGDNILSINGVGFDGYGDRMLNVLSKNENDYLELKIERNNEILELESMKIDYEDSNKGYVLGIEIGTEYKKPYTFIETIPLSCRALLLTSKQMVEAFIKTFTFQQDMKDMSGIVGIVTVMSDKKLTQAMSRYFELIALISLNLGIINMMPLGILDGGKAIEALYQIVSKKRINRKLINIYNTACGLMLISLMIYLTFQDLFNLINK